MAEVLTTSYLESLEYGNTPTINDALEDIKQKTDFEGRSLQD